MAFQATQNERYDAIVVGSGATGGWAAKKLTENGMRVALLEAGANVSKRDYSEHTMPWQLPYLGMSPKVLKDRPIQGTCYACTEYNSKWFVNDLENPYTQEKPFKWIRMRVVGGRSLSWGRQSYRMGDIDFKAASRDGYGEDWPIQYSDLVPYYEEVEKYVGISGLAEGLEQLPDSIFQPAMQFTCTEQHLRDQVKAKMGRVVTMGRTAILTKPLNGRQACHYCGPCERGCTTNSYFSSPFTTIADALKTGRLTMITDAVAARILMGDNGKADGIEYIDRLTREAKKVRAKVMVLCASTLESTRLLLNSDLCNSSDMLGRNLMDHIYQGGASGLMPMFEAKPWAGAPRRPTGIYVPRFRNVKEKMTNGFIRGYGYQGGSTPAFSFNAPGFGKAYKDGVRNGFYNMSLGLWGECLARPENRVQLEKSKPDAWGVPTLKINAEWGDNEKKLWEDGRVQAAEMLEAAGAQNVQKTGTYSVPGFCIHEIGTARMSNDRKKGVLNKYCQTHDVENIFVTDGAAWVSSGCQNPTLTMMAITVRACDYITREYAKRMV
ncbi:GMC family oxidoreductase [Bryobacter aggregatus]|uniref:GMC family oxidoreductase n=1 Tax=Bryobacter aggregatus TaxID=360054 RepID=UPI0004E1257B|nr:GMC family oxidoreductase [Bryobacter aggregatus]